jgi:hypothetical protein
MEGHHEQLAWALPKTLELLTVEQLWGLTCPQFMVHPATMRVVAGAYKLMSALCLPLSQIPLAGSSAVHGGWVSPGTVLP